MQRVLLTLIATAALAIATLPVFADDAANEALARRFYTEFNARNFDALPEFVAADIVDHTAPPGGPSGIDMLTKELKDFATGFSDLQITNELVLVSGDHVTVISRCKGTNDGAMMEMPATNKPVAFQAIDVWLVKDGKLAEVWHVEQLMQMMTQMGAMGGGT